MNLKIGFAFLLVFAVTAAYRDQGADNLSNEQINEVKRQLYEKYGHDQDETDEDKYLDLIDLDDDDEEADDDMASHREKRDALFFPRLRIPRLRIPRFRIPPVRIPRYRFPRIRIPRYRIPRYRIPRYRIPRFRIPRYRIPRYRIPHFIRFGKKK